MCGITGYYSTRNHFALKDELSASVHALRHRGPDDSGLFVDEAHGVGLGHRRLSILDLSPAGHQPMVSDDERFVIVFNGEIYNYKAIKHRLKQLGYEFKSDSDTEVILNAFLQWGTACLDYFVGMFAFAIWDRLKQRLFLARDRLGIKPLYYYLNADTFLFGSELKALMAFSNYPRMVDRDALQLFLHYQYIPTPKTIFSNTFKLEPGHFLVYDGRTLDKKQWWKIPDTNSGITGRESLNETEQIEKLDQLLTQAVSDRLISDVPLGALLSGGIDSSIIVAMMRKISSARVKTFSIGFQEEGFNEAPWAAKIAKHLGTEHTELYVTSKDALAVIPQLPYIYSEPFADSSSIPTFLVSRMTRGQVTVALSGDGGDELFAGYTRYWMTTKMAGWMKRVPGAFRHRFKQMLDKLPITEVNQFYAKLRFLLPRRLQVENFPDKWIKFINQLGCCELSELYRMTISIWSKDEIFKLTGATIANSAFETVFSNKSGLGILKTLMGVDQQTYLPDGMLTKVDRASMAASLEVRVPLLDHRIVEFAANLPELLLYRNGKGKYLLTRLLLNYVPSELVERPKMGFGVPIAQWLRSSLFEMVNDYLSTERVAREGRFDSIYVNRILKEHIGGTKNHQHKLWTLLMWEIWREKWGI